MSVTRDPHTPWRVLAMLCSLTAIAMVVAAALGPLGAGTIQFSMNRNAIAQYEGGEVVTLLAALVLVYCARRFWQHDDKAAAIVIGPASYVVYTMVTVVLGQEIEQFPDGNSERFNFLYMAITAGCSAISVLSMNQLISRHSEPDPGWRKITMWVLGIKAALFTFAWSVQIIEVYQNGWSQLMREQRTLFWLVKYLDLGFLVPMAFALIWLIHVRAPLARPLVLLQLGFTTFMMAAIAGMTLNMWRLEEEGGSLGLAIAMLVLAAIATIVVLPWIRCANTVENDIRR